MIHDREVCNKKKVGTAVVAWVQYHDYAAIPAVLPIFL